MKRLNDPAFPIACPVDFQYAEPGISTREYASIALRVPNSGDAEIDAMIRAAERRDIAAIAMQGLLPRVGMDSRLQDVFDIAVWSVQAADALIAELAKAEPEGVAAPDDGWIEWGGVGLPVDRSTEIEADLLGGGRFIGSAEELRCIHNRWNSDIIRYRIVKEG